MNTSPTTSEPSGLAGVWKEEAAATMRLALPIVLTQLGWVAMLTTDAIMIGRLGATALAGATFVLMIYFAVYVFAIGLAMATAGLAAQAYGARRPRRVRRIIRQGLWVMILISLPGIGVMSFTGEILVFLRQPAEAIEPATRYMQSLMWSLPPAIAFVVLRNFVAALNRPAVALWVMLFTVPFNALLDYALIYGNFGLPRLELFGAGIATTIANTAMFSVLLAIALYARPFRRYSILGRFWRPDWEQFRQIFRIGLPIAGMMLLETGFFIFAAFMMGWIGTAAVAAHMIAIQVPHITFMVPMGLSQAATVRVGHAVGRGDARAAYRASWTALTISLGFMATTSIVILLIPATLAGLFLDANRPDSVEALTLATTLLFFAAIFQASDGIQAVAAGALRGLNDTALPMMIAALCYWAIGFSSGAALGFWAGWGARGIWMGFVLGLTSAAILLSWRLTHLTRRRYLPSMLGQV
ncbi:MAG: MATE family efflux transporter [Alphaproteobacteria bacterium]